MKINLKSILLAVVGIFCVGVGLSFVNNAMLGNDSIGILYDGIRNTANLTTAQLGTASNIANYGLALVLFFIGRRYINIGTLIYILPYGFFVNLGTNIYNYLALPETIFIRILVAIIGFLMIYLGLGIYIATDIGVEPFTGLVMLIKDKLKKEYASVKIVFDLILVTIGVLLGGKFGIMTLITAFSAGPIIQFFSKKVTGILNRQMPQFEDYSPDIIHELCDENQ